MRYSSEHCTLLYVLQTECRDTSRIVVTGPLANPTSVKLIETQNPQKDRRDPNQTLYKKDFEFDITLNIYL